jgi:hypothetical protein
MNVQFWFWMLLGGIFTLAVVWLVQFLKRLSDPLPEDALVIARPLNWENVEVTFNLNDAKAEILGSARSVARRLLRFRLAASLEFLQRMEHNAWVIEQSALADQRDAGRAKASMVQDRQASLSDARGMLAGAELFESDARHPEYADQADELHEQAGSLRLTAQQLFGSAEFTEHDARALKAAEALQSAQRFRAAVRPYLMKLDLLILLLRLDAAGILPVGAVIAVWHQGSAPLLLLYQDTRTKGVAYLSIYHQDEDLLTLI